MTVVAGATAGATTPLAFIGDYFQEIINPVTKTKGVMLKLKATPSIHNKDKLFRSCWIFLHSDEVT